MSGKRLVLAFAAAVEAGMQLTMLLTFLVWMFLPRVHGTRQAAAGVTVIARPTGTHVMLPGGWSYPLVRFTHETCNFVGVQNGTSLTSVWHHPKCLCQK